MMMLGNDVFASKMTGQDAESARALLRIAPASSKTTFNLNLVMMTNKNQDIRAESYGA